jgi:hypothetical protein
MKRYILNLIEKILIILNSSEIEIEKGLPVIKKNKCNKKRSRIS